MAVICAIAVYRFVPWFLFFKIVQYVRLGNNTRWQLQSCGYGWSFKRVMHCPLTAVFLIAEITNGYELLFP